MKKTIFLMAVLTGMFGCSSDTLTIKDATAAGFIKQQQKLFQMVGAKDGWSGTLGGEKVELYEFESQEKVNSDIFKAATRPGNASGWVELCEVKNMLLLSKGTKACEILKGL